MPEWRGGQSRRRSANTVKQIISQLQNDCWALSGDVHESAMKAQEMARSAESPLLEAQATLLLGRTFSLMLFPEKVLLSASRALRIFQANHLPASVAHCKVLMARAYLGMGRNREAIEHARSALNDIHIKSEHRIAALAFAAMSHGYLGEIDTARCVLREEVMPLVGNVCAANLQVLVYQTMVNIELQSLLLKRYRVFHSGVIAFASNRGGDLHGHHILKLIRAARLHLPEGVEWPILDVMEILVHGLTETPEASLDGLRTLFASYGDRDPMVGCLSHLATSLLYQCTGAYRYALRYVNQGLRMANSWGLELVAGDCYFQKAWVYEALGNAHHALRCYKVFWIVRDKRMHISRATTKVANNHMAQLDAWAHESMPIAKLRNLEPVSVRRAVEYIRMNLATKILVSDVANYCGVSRRTLEIVFKSTLETSVAQYIKRRRLELAAEKLRGTRFGIKEISLAVGYSSAAAFGRDFLNHFGLSPAKWRRISMGMAS